MVPPELKLCCLHFVNEHCHELIMKPFVKGRIFQKMLNMYH